MPRAMAARMVHVGEEPGLAMADSPDSALELADDFLAVLRDRVKISRDIRRVPIRQTEDRHPRFGIHFFRVADPVGQVVRTVPKYTGHIQALADSGECRADES